MRSAGSSWPRLPGTRAVDGGADAGPSKQRDEARVIWTVLQVAAISVGVYLAIALLLILSQSPADAPAGPTLDFDRLSARRDMPPEDGTSFVRTEIVTPDGYHHPVTRVAAPGAANRPLIVMIHGSGWHNAQFDRLAWALRDVAELRAVTLRGHGPNPARRGDIDTIGQFEDDLAHLIGPRDDRRVILLGHSSGGGLVIRFAGGAHRGLIDGAILLAPFLHHTAPTTRPGSGGWARPLTRRMIGLSMLNMIGLHLLDGMTAIQFAFPRDILDGPQGRFATPAYAWRLNLSFAPRRDYLADIAQLPPFLLVAGRDDEAFRADLFEPTMRPATDKGAYVLLDGAGHLDVVDDPRTEAAIRRYLDAQ